MPVSDKKVTEGYDHCLEFFERNYPNASKTEKNWFLNGVLTYRDFLEGK